MTATRARLAIGAALVIIALTAAAFWLSYAHLHAVAASHGLANSAARAWAWPATLDLFIVAGELLMLRASLARTTDWWAIALTVVGSGGSIALNVFGVGGSDPLAYVTAAVPPTAALLAFGALMRQIHALLAEHEPAAATAPDASASPEAASPTATAIPAKAASTALPVPASAAVSAPARPLPVAAPKAASDPVAADLPTPVAAPSATANEPATPAPAPSTAAASGSDQRDLDHVADTYRALAAELGRTPSDAKLADALGVGRSRAQQLRTAAIEAGHTDLAKPLRAAS